jgi:hypothetical protein
MRAGLAWRYHRRVQALEITTGTLHAQCMGMQRSLREAMVSAVWAMFVAKLVIIALRPDLCLG